MDWWFCVHHQSMWGYLLGHAFLPNMKEGHAIVMHHFAYVMAVPGLYEQAMNPEYLLSDLATSTVTIIRFGTQDVVFPNFGHDEIVCHLIHNQILTEWMTHAYYYGHHYLCQHLQAGDRYCIENMLVNGEHIDTLVTQDEPKVYPP